MQPVFTPTKPIDRTVLPGMLATLCSYESVFGPYHPQTLCLMTQVANAYSQAGEFDCARPLLERAVRDVGRYLGRDHNLRLRAIETLRDLFIAQREYERAGVIQHELLECQTQRLGAFHPETLATRDHLGLILLEQMRGDSNKVL